MEVDHEHHFTFTGKRDGEASHGFFHSHERGEEDHIHRVGERDPKTHKRPRAFWGGCVARMEDVRK